MPTQRPVPTQPPAAPPNESAPPSATVGADEPATSPDAWRRPHPLTILALVGDVFRGAGLGLIAILALNAGDGFSWFEQLAALATFGSGLVRWWSTRYRITPTHIEHRHGVFRRNEQIMERTRIQNVGLTSPLIARVLGLSSVDVAEASADGNISIRYLAREEAEKMAKLLEPATAAIPAQTPAFDGDLADAPPPGMTPPGLAPPEGARTTTLHQGALGPLLRFELGRLVPNIPVVIPAGIMAYALSLSDAPLLVRIGFPVAALLMPLLGALSPLMVYGGYRLSRTAGGLELQGGLLTERRVVIQPDRIQTLTWVDHPLGRRSGIRSLGFSTAEVGHGGMENGEVSVELDRLVPAADADEVDRIAVLAGRPIRVDDDRLRRVSPLTIRRAALRWSIPTLAAPALWFVRPWLPFVVVPIWWAAAWLAARRRYEILGVATDDVELVGRTGWWISRTTRLSVDRIQGVRMTSTPFQRRLGLATLVVGTAGVRGDTAVVVPDLTADDAHELGRRLALCAARAEDPFEL